MKKGCRMKVVESGMPDEEIWETFFNPGKILRKMGLSKDMIDVADFGSGYGTFTLPAAKMISGMIYAIDIEEELIKSLKDKIKRLDVKNVDVSYRDIESEGAGLGSGSVDYVMLFNILHSSHPEKLLSEAYRILRLGGRIGIIHWNYDSTTPRGPPIELRLKPEQIIKAVENTGFSMEKRLELKPHHYGLVMRKMEIKTVVPKVLLK